jgi:hypothetical protein
MLLPKLRYFENSGVASALFMLGLAVRFIGRRSAPLSGASAGPGSLSGNLGHPGRLPWRDATDADARRPNPRLKAHACAAEILCSRPSRKGLSFRHDRNP